MSWYLVRVELLNEPSNADYTTLHQRMQSAGFNRWVISDSKQQFELPPAEYFRDSEESLDEVHKRADAAIQNGLRPLLSYRMFTSKIQSWRAKNLKSVTA
ncbi:conserved hypothetical protein [Paraburkholderia tropica]